MVSPEVFYIHIHGEQRGPYTMRQIDHMLNSSIIAPETLYWREGLDQWQPVTSLVVVRKAKARRLAKPAIVLGVVLLLLAAFASIVGPSVVMRWHEFNQHEYTPLAAYWRARDVVRTQAVPSGALVEFGGFSTAETRLLQGDRAAVVLRGDLTDATGQTHPATWNVAMQFDPKGREWTGAPMHDAAAR